ncbi:MAG: TerC/Alx family metal homeostasis membrane protein [Ferruginibacter sp.]
MDTTTLIYLVFSGVIILALVVDLGLLSKKNAVISIRMAVIQTIFWITLSMLFAGFIWYEQGYTDMIQYVSAYLLEWSLSIDNIFVFIIIFSFFKVPQKNYSRVLLLGILMAIVFRILFIAIGTELVARFSWIMYVFGGFLIYTGFKMFSTGDDHDFDPEASWAYRIMKRTLPTTNENPHGKFIVKHNNKIFFTRLSMVVFMLGLIDIVFAIDSIPAVFSIIPDPRDKLLIYSSNIFAVLGLRSLFFLLRGAAAKFSYLQQGIAVVLLFIGVKMIAEHWISIPVWASLMVIIVCIVGSVLYSVFNDEEKDKNDDENDAGEKKAAVFLQEPPLHKN